MMECELGYYRYNYIDTRNHHVIMVDDMKDRHMYVGRYHQEDTLSLGKLQILHYGFKVISQDD